MSDSNLNSTTEAAETALGLTPGQKLTKDEARAKIAILRAEATAARAEMDDLKAFLASQQALFQSHIDGLRQALTAQQQQQQQPEPGREPDNDSDK